jgi:hypothetical protein
MELLLTDPEMELLKGLLEADYSRLILEIARTDHREARDEMKKREILLSGILAKLGSTLRRAS